MIDKVFLNIYVKLLGLMILLLLPSIHIRAYAEDKLIRFVRQDSSQVWLSEQGLKREWLLASRVQTISKQQVGRMRLSPGQRLQDPLWIRFSVEHGKLLVWRQGERTKGKKHQHTSPWLKIPIVSKQDGGYLIDFTPLMARLHDGLDPVAGRMAPEGIGVLPQVSYRGTHSKGLELSLSQQFKGLKIELRHSLYLLPEEVMPSRMSDARVGYYSLFTKQEGQKQKSIHRYRLAPGDTIVYWVDRDFPKLWQEAIVAGIEDWNIAFKEIGLGNVLQAKIYPRDSIGFDVDAMTLNTFRYVESSFPNAQGKFWSDPRSGEIIQSDVLFYSSVSKLLHKWYYLMTAAHNVDARSAKLSDSAEYRLIRYAAAHEIGHCLGLEHNYRASASYPTDSLRSRTFTRIYGTTPSIMDYARCNNIAQPEDGVEAFYPPLLGEYDKYAIAYGYGLYNAEELEQLVSEASSKSYLRYEKAIKGTGAKDPATQPAGLGDDGLKSVDYALRNLRYILQHRADWETSPISMADIAEAYYGNLHLLLPYLGGVYRHTLSRDGSTVKETPVDKAYQERVRAYLRQEIERGKTLFPDRMMGGKLRKAVEAYQHQWISKLHPIRDIMNH